MGFLLAVEELIRALLFGDRALGKKEMQRRINLSYNIT